MVVELKMDGALREEGGLIGPDLIVDEFGTVLRYHARDERAVGNVIELCRSRVGVRGVHAAWSEETDGCETWDQLGRDSAQTLFILIETSFPMVAGIVTALAEELKPPAPAVFPAGGCAKSNLNASSGRRLSLARSVGASRRLAISSVFPWAATVEKAMAERMKSPEIIIKIEGEGREEMGEYGRDRVWHLCVLCSTAVSHADPFGHSGLQTGRAVSDQQRARERSISRAGLQQITKITYPNRFKGCAPLAVPGAHG